MNNKDYADWLHQYEPVFYREVRRYFSDWDTIQDAAQEAMIHVWQQSQAADWHSTIGLVNCARLTCKFVCLRMLRDYDRRHEVLYARQYIPPDLISHYDEPHVAQEPLGSIGWYAALSKEDQTVVRLLYQDYSQRDVAKELDRTRSSIYGCLARLRRKLKCHIK